MLTWHQPSSLLASHRSSQTLAAAAQNASKFLGCLSLPPSPLRFWIQSSIFQELYCHYFPGQHIPASHCVTASSKEAFPVSKIKVKDPSSTLLKHPALLCHAFFHTLPYSCVCLSLSLHVELHENRDLICPITIISPEPSTLLGVELLNKITFPK